MVDVEKRVFKCFGHDGAGELLPAHYEGETRFALVGKKVGTILEQQHVAYEAEIRGLEIKLARLGLFNGLFNHSLVLWRNFQITNVCAIYGEVGGGFDQSVSQLTSGQVARVAIVVGKHAKLMAEG